MNNVTCNKYLIIEYFGDECSDNEYSDNTSKHYVMHTSPLMTHAQAVDELSRLCKEYIHTKFAIYKIYEY